MEKKVTTRIDPETGEDLVRDIRPLTLAYKKQTMTIMMPGWYAENDPEGSSGLFEAKDTKVSDRAINFMKAKEVGLLVPDEIRKIRKKLGLTQREAGLIIGGGPNAFQKYEAGDILISKAADTALRLLYNNPKRLSEIPRSKVA